MATCNCCGGHDRATLFTVHGHTLGRCTTCNLHYVDPMPDLDQRRALQAAGEYGDGLRVLDGERQLASERTRTAQFKRYVDLIAHYAPASGTVLDVGCGAGHLMTLVQATGKQVEGIELTADRLAVAGRVTDSTIHDRPVEELDLPGGRYVAVTLINVFSHLVDPAGTFAELARVLSPGGVLVVATGEIDGHVRKEHLPEWTLGEELFFLGSGTIDRYAERAGMEIVDSQRTWLPDALYTRERFKVRGRSRTRNLVKSVALTPGVLPVVRRVVRRRQADNPIHSAVYVLRKP